MMIYAKLLCKRLSKRTSNVCLLLASLCILAVVQLLNLNLQSEFREKLENQMVVYDEAINDYTELLSNTSTSSSDFSSYQETIEMNRTLKEKQMEILNYYDQADWENFYENYLVKLNEEYDVIENSFGDSKDGEKEMMVKQSDFEITYVAYLDEHDLVYENPMYPVFGLSFLSSISQTVLPILCLICCIYILAQLFTMDYFEKIDMSDMLPMGKKKKELTKVVLGIVISLSIYVGMILFAFLFSICVTFHTGFDYPIMVQEVSSHFWQAINLLNVLSEWMLLGVLYYVSVSLAVYLVSKVMKDEVPLFLMMVCVMLGLAYLPKITSMVMLIAQYLPTTYLNLVKIVTGDIANQYGNPYISFGSGVMVLCIFILVQGILIWFYIRRKQHRNG